jgi:hypothetical protein
MRGLRLGFGLNSVATSAAGGASGNTHAYRYYRLNISAVQVAGNVPGLVEMEIATTAGGADTTAGRTYSATTEFPGEEASKAFDDNTGTNWGGFDNSLPQWLKVDYGATSGDWIAANQLKITARGGGSVDQAPKDFTFQGSDDNSAWTTLITKTGEAWTASETKTYQVP